MGFPTRNGGLVGSAEFHDVAKSGKFLFVNLYIDPTNTYSVFVGTSH